MKRNLNHLTLFTILFLVGIIYGIVIQKNKLFPHRYLKKAYNHFLQQFDSYYGPWSIGIYEGSTPFDLVDPEDISNPVLTAEDVDDIDAKFVADPFMLLKDGKYFIFFEVLNRENEQGDIGYAESLDGKNWKYRKVIIDETFHLSYPYVFEWKDNYYLIPESSKDYSVRLYKATSFPEKWEYITDLLYGHRYLDPSVFHYKDTWWMFVGAGDNNVLNLYFSDNLISGWRPHPMNPIVKKNKHIARPGGRVFAYKDKLYRLTQDDDPVYGIQVFAFEIKEVTKSTYVESLASQTPIVTKTEKGWNAAGMHHVDLHKVGIEWVSVVDGRYE